MKEIFGKIKPTPDEEKVLIKAAGDLLKLVITLAQKDDGRISARLVGSSSRGTWLRHEKDLDIFVLFPLEYDKKEMEGMVTRIGQTLLEEPRIHYAEHPYIKGIFSGYHAELVPCYAISTPSEIKSAVDRTPFHEEFVIENISGREDEVRLLKQFLKGIGAYGAEAKTQGVSGYLAELLIIKYGTFDKFLKQAASWMDSVVIQIHSDYPNREIRKKFSEPMIFVDPVDRKRNVASAVSADKLALIIFAAKEYIKKPGIRFFFPRQREVSLNEAVKRFEARKTSLLALIFPIPDVVDDILYPQMRRAQGAVTRILESMDFRVVGNTFFLREQGCIFIELESLKIPTMKLHRGPQVNSEHEDRFLEKHSKNTNKLSGPFITGGRWFIYLKRQYVDAKELMVDFIEKGNMEESGIPSHVSKTMEGKTKIKSDGEAITKEFATDIMEYLEPTFPWMR